MGIYKENYYTKGKFYRTFFYQQKKKAEHFKYLYFTVQIIYEYPYKYYNICIILSINNKFGKNYSM